jgi:hypothetical protein
MFYDNYFSKNVVHVYKYKLRIYSFLKHLNLHDIMDTFNDIIDTFIQNLNLYNNNICEYISA